MKYSKMRSYLCIWCEELFALDRVILNPERSNDQYDPGNPKIICFTCIDDLFYSYAHEIRRREEEEE